MRLVGADSALPTLFFVHVFSLEAFAGCVAAANAECCCCCWVVAAAAVPWAIVAATGLSSYAIPYHLRTSKRQHALHCATITILGYPFPAATLATKAGAEGSGWVSRNVTLKYKANERTLGYLGVNYDIVCCAFANTENC